MQFLQNCIRPFFVCTSFCTFEGADNSDNGGNLAFMISSAEAIETAAVTTSNYDAGFGRAGGAMTNVTLKTGTNVFTLGGPIKSRRPRQTPGPAWNGAAC